MAVNTPELEKCLWGAADEDSDLLRANTSTRTRDLPLEDKMGETLIWINIRTTIQFLVPFLPIRPNRFMV